MAKYLVGLLALAAVGVAVFRPRPAVTPEPAAEVAAAAPAPAGPPAVVDVIDLAAELDRPVAEPPFVPFDG